MTVMNDNRERVYLLDEIRGFCILCMVCYHTVFDLQIFEPALFAKYFSWFNGAAMDTVRDVFAGGFIFISGIVCRYSRNNLKRGAQLFFIACILTFVTAFVMPETPDMFGILHLLGVSMLLFGLFGGYIDKIPGRVGIGLSAVLFFVTRGVDGGMVLFGSVVLPRAVYDAYWLYPLGFISPRFGTADWFPLLPWVFLFICGACAGRYVKEGVFPKIFYVSHCKPLGAVGRVTLWIYILHQPVVWLIFTAITGGSVF